ncbi:hypothetical protein ACC739_38120, partial [Rhizobium ruizarguesonis]
ADIGVNRLTGNVEFSPSLEPTGALTFDFPNFGLLAALGGQKAEGDRKRITADRDACCKQFERDPAAVAADAERTLEI